MGSPSEALGTFLAGLRGVLHGFERMERGVEALAYEFPALHETAENLLEGIRPALTGTRECLQIGERMIEEWRE